MRGFGLIPLANALEGAAWTSRCYCTGEEKEGVLNYEIGKRHESKVMSQSQGNHHLEC